MRKAIVLSVMILSVMIFTIGTITSQAAPGPNTRPKMFVGMWERSLGYDYGDGNGVQWDREVSTWELTKDGKCVCSDGFQGTWYVATVKPLPTSQENPRHVRCLVLRLVRREPLRGALRGTWHCNCPIVKETDNEIICNLGDESLRLLKNAPKEEQKEKK